MAGFEPTPPQETGFFAKSVGDRDFGQKTRFLGPVLELVHCDSETGFFPKSVAFTKNFGKNPVSRPRP
ncbi:hypothetical protein QUA86_33995 [Microcoleus sp. F6_B6]